MDRIDGHLSSLNRLKLIRESVGKQSYALSLLNGGEIERNFIFQFLREIIPMHLRMPLILDLLLSNGKRRLALIWDWIAVSLSPQMPTYNSPLR